MKRSMTLLKEMYNVSITSCDTYDLSTVKESLERLLSSVGGLDFINKGETVVIKANLVSAMKPETAAVTHPKVISALCDILHQKGANVIVGDSPGGLYNSAFLNHVYSVSGMREVTAHHAELNDDFSTKSAYFKDAALLKNFEYTAYLDKADHIINFCKLKSHGMMGMSAAAKNMFGVIPGITKPQYHYRFPDHKDFADMLVDINEYFKDKVRLNIIDAVVAMEGNGPTQGTPKKVGALIASQNPHAADLLAAQLIGLGVNDLPMLRSAHSRGLIPETADKLCINQDYQSFIQKDFETVTIKGILFEGDGASKFRGFVSKFLGSVLKTEPRLKKKECVGCNVCGNICPAKAITMKKGKAVIEKEKCIRCFCCQEFCPKGAMKVHRTAISRLVEKL